MTIPEKPSFALLVGWALPAQVWLTCLEAELVRLRCLVVVERLHRLPGLAVVRELVSGVIPLLRLVIKRVGVLHTVTETGKSWITRADNTEGCTQLSKTIWNFVPALQPLKLHSNILTSYQAECRVRAVIGQCFSKSPLIGCHHHARARSMFIVGK